MISQSRLELALKINGPTHSGGMGRDAVDKPRYVGMLEEDSSMIKHFFKWCLVAAFPWLVLLYKDNPGGALLALVMQTSIIGWIPASLWALRALNEEKKENNSKKTEID